jgi:peptidase E
MISVPTVQPGDMVFWQCDVVHAVEKEHTGKGDSSVMYIPAVPSCSQNKEYIAKQAELFKKGCPPPDFPQGRTELDYKLVATEKDLVNPLGRAAMGIRA